MKSHELEKRKEARAKAQENLEEAKEVGTAVEVRIRKKKFFPKNRKYVFWRIRKDMYFEDFEKYIF